VRGLSLLGLLNNAPERIGPGEGRQMNDAAASANSPCGQHDDRFADALRGFGPVGIFAMLVIVAGQIVAPLSAVLVLVWVKLSRTPWREIGYVRPRSWIGGLVVGIAVGVVFKFLLKTIVMPLLGANPINQAYHHLAGNPTAAAPLVLQMIITAGFGEETFSAGTCLNDLASSSDRT
jgi:membrane protease YdiL (CAAX protease family)